MTDEISVSSTESTLGFQSRLVPIGVNDALRVGGVRAHSQEQTLAVVCPMCGHAQCDAVTIWNGDKKEKPKEPAYTAFVCELCTEAGRPVMGLYADGFSPM